MTLRCLTNWVSGYLELTRNAPTPFIFKKWAAFAALQAAATCRVHVRTEQGFIYPNSMIILVGDPGVGKGPAINPVEQLLREIDTTGNALHQFESIHCGPHDCTVAGLFDEFIDTSCHKTYRLDNETFTFQSVSIIAEELSAFMHHVDLQMMGYMIKFLNCDTHSQRLRSQGKTLTIEKPVLSILAGVQPSVLAHIFPPQAFTMGLTARTTFVYSNKHTKVSPFTPNKVDPKLAQKLAKDLRRITSLCGKFSFTEDAQQLIDNWWFHEADQDQQSHPKLANYNTKRIQHLIRLCMIHSLARSDLILIEGQDVHHAISDLREVEAAMPSIFESMTSETSQMDIVSDILHQIVGEFQRTRKPVPYHVVARFASRKVRAYEVPTIIDALVAQELLEERAIGIKLPGVANHPKAFIPKGG